jgi:hypothetical protein
MSTDNTATTWRDLADQLTPEQVALELIVRMPGEILGHDSPPIDALQDFTCPLIITDR